jgi:hypothetical protein
MVNLNKGWASDSGHWYTKTGDPAYTYTGKDGSQKNTTLREARKMGLVPSVTTITKVLASPGLQEWKSRQILMSALTLPRREGESDDSFVDRILTDSTEQTRNAANRGEEGHAAIECSFRNLPYDPTWKATVEACREAIDQAFPKVLWTPERSFAHDMGFGGRVDLQGMGVVDGKSTGIVIDFKSKDGDLSDVKCFDEHLMQGAAYVWGLFNEGQSANLFFSRTEPGKVKLLIHTPEEHERGRWMFHHCLKLWQIKNKYDPSGVNNALEK